MRMCDVDLNAAAQAIRGPTCVVSAASDDATADPNAESALVWGFWRIGEGKYGAYMREDHLIAYVRHTLDTPALARRVVYERRARTRRLCVVWAYEINTRE